MLSSLGNSWNADFSRDKSVRTNFRRINRTQQSFHMSDNKEGRLTMGMKTARVDAVQVGSKQGQNVGRYGGGYSGRNTYNQQQNTILTSTNPSQLRHDYHPKCAFQLQPRKLTLTYQNNQHTQSFTLRHQTTCLTQISQPQQKQNLIPTNSHTSRSSKTSRSSTRKKTQVGLFGLVDRNERKGKTVLLEGRDGRDGRRQEDLRDAYIQGFIRTQNDCDIDIDSNSNNNNKNNNNNRMAVSFVDSIKETDNTISFINNTSLTQQTCPPTSSSPFSPSLHPSSPSLHPPTTRYQKIRHTMLRLKNLTQLNSTKTKQSKNRKCPRLDTTEEEWGQIERIVEAVKGKGDGEEKIMEDIQETKRMYEQKDNADEKQKVAEIRLNSKEVESWQGQAPQPMVQLPQLATEPVNNPSTSAQLIEPTRTTAPDSLPTLPTPAPKTTRIPAPSEQPQILNTKITPTPSQQPHSVPAPSPLLPSLLTLFQHILYLVPTVIEKTSRLCQQLGVKEADKAIQVFFEYLYLNKRLVEVLGEREIEKGKHQRNDSGEYDYEDYSQVLRQIKKDNNKNLKYVGKLFPHHDPRIVIIVGQDISKQSAQSMNPSNGNNDNTDSPQSLSSSSATLNLLQQLITQKHESFTSLNMRMIKRLLKKISSSSSTSSSTSSSSSQLQHLLTFLNYSNSFTNLTCVHSTIQSITNHTLSLPSHLSQHSSQQYQQQIIKYFLYSDDKCGFLQPRYLQTKEKVFEMEFQIDCQHERVEGYYREVIKRLKGVVGEGGVKGGVGEEEKAVKG